MAHGSSPLVCSPITRSNSTENQFVGSHSIAKHYRPTFDTHTRPLAAFVTKKKQFSICSLSVRLLKSFGGLFTCHVEFLCRKVLLTCLEIGLMTFKGELKARLELEFVISYGQYGMSAMTLYLTNQNMYPFCRYL
jgi:hypothetical protein